MLSNFSVNIVENPIVAVGLFSKIMPNFCQTVNWRNFSPLFVYWFLAKTLGPTIFEIPQPNRTDINTQQEKKKYYSY